MTQYIVKTIDVTIKIKRPYRFSQWYNIFKIIDITTKIKPPIRFSKSKITHFIHILKTLDTTLRINKEFKPINIFNEYSLFNVDLCWEWSFGLYDPKQLQRNQIVLVSIILKPILARFVWKNMIGWTLTCWVPFKGTTTNQTKKILITNLRDTVWGYGICLLIYLFPNFFCFYKNVGITILQNPKKKYFK